MTSEESEYRVRSPTEMLMFKPSEQSAKEYLEALLNSSGLCRQPGWSEADVVEAITDMILGLSSIGCVAQVDSNNPLE